MKKSLLIYITFFVVLAFLNKLLDNFIEDFINDYIKPYLTHVFEIKAYTLMYIIVFALLIFYLYRNHKTEKISVLENNVAQLEGDLREETKALWRNFSDLNRFNQQELILKALKQITDNDRSVMAAQIYEYEYKEKKVATTIKVTHTNGYVTEGEKLNALLQEYYTIEVNLFQHFKRALIHLSKGNEKVLLKFLEKYKNQLNKKTKAELSEDVIASVTYSMIYLGLQLYALSNGFRYDSFGVLDEERDKILTDNKRTGLLRGIILQELFDDFGYIFFHEGNNDKKGRIYITSGMKINGKKTMFLFTLFNNVQKDSLNEKAADLDEMFQELLLLSGVDVKPLV